MHTLARPAEAPQHPFGYTISEMNLSAGRKLAPYEIVGPLGAVADLAPVGPRSRYLPSRDGQKFLIPTPVHDEFAKAFTVIVNWPSLLAKQAER